LQPRNEFASPILVFAFKYSFCWGPVEYYAMSTAFQHT
jgi:hypothetical protein